MPIRPMGHGHVYEGAQASSRRVGVFILSAFLLALLLTLLSLAVGHYQREGVDLDGPSGYPWSRDRMLETEATKSGDEGDVSESPTSRSANVDVSSCPPPAPSVRDLMPGWKPCVPSVVLRRGVAYEGDMLRMDQFLHKVHVTRDTQHMAGVCRSTSTVISVSKNLKDSCASPPPNRQQTSLMTP